MDLVADWYMREPDPKQRSLASLPRLYQKYIGHDNNRDFFANTQAETKNMNRVMYREWFPQIVYNHHQTGPAGHGPVLRRRSATRSTTTSTRWSSAASTPSARR